MLDRVLASNSRVAQKSRVLEVNVVSYNKLKGNVVEGNGASTLVSSANPNDAAEGDGASTEMSSAPNRSDAVGRVGASTTVSSAAVTSDEPSPSAETTSQPSPQGLPASIDAPVAGPSSTPQTPQPGPEIDNDGADGDESDSDSSDDEALMEESPIPLRDRIASKYNAPVKSELTATQFRRHMRGMNRKIRKKLARIQRKLAARALAEAEG